jgi:RNA polymerase sigma factor (sigma-70 family)
MDNTLLVKACLNGNAAAQQQLYSKFAPSMLGVCYRYTKSIQDAEDVLLEGFVKVFMHLESYKQTGELGAWIRRIMVTTALNYLKKHKKYRHEMAYSEMPLHPISDDNPIMTLQSKDLADLIRQLPTGYQTIFNLYAIEGFNHIEIGQLLGISEGTSKSQYARARYLLIEWINKMSITQPQQQYGTK